MLEQNYVASIIMIVYVATENYMIVLLSILYNEAFNCIKLITVLLALC